MLTARLTVCLAFSILGLLIQQMIWKRTMFTTSIARRMEPMWRRVVAVERASSVFAVLTFTPPMMVRVNANAQRVDSAGRPMDMMGSPSMPCSHLLTRKTCQVSDKCAIAWLDRRSHSPQERKVTQNERRKPCRQQCTRHSAQSCVRDVFLRGDRDPASDDVGCQRAVGKRGVA